MQLNSSGNFNRAFLVDVSASDVVDSVTAFSTTPAFYSFTREVNHVTGLRGRVGFGHGRAMFYGTGGAAAASLEQSFTTSNTVNTFVRFDDADDDDEDEGDSKSVWGYQAGGGIEVRLWARLTLTGDYLFTRLNDREESTVRAMGPAPATNPFILVNAGGTDMQRTERFEFHTVRTGLNFRF